MFFFFWFVKELGRNIPSVDLLNQLKKVGETLSPKIEFIPTYY